MTEEEEAIDILLKMSKSELDLVPYDTVKLICQAKGCKRHTKIRDYGIAPVYYVHRFKIGQQWHNVLKSYFLCAKHWSIKTRLIKRFEVWRVQQRMLDFDKQNIEKL